MKRILKIIGYVLLGILVLLIVLGFILPKDISTTVTSNINASPNYTYNVLANPSVNGWSALENMDSSATFTYMDKVGTGAGFSWTGDQGKGRMEISQAELNSKISREFYLDDASVPSIVTYLLSPNGATSDVEVNWSGHFGFPKNIMGPFISRRVKSSIKDELKRLGDLVAERAQEGIYSGYQISPLDVSESFYIANRSEVNTASVQQFYSQNLSSIFRTLQESNVETIGPDCALIYKYDNQRNEVDIAAALPIGTDVSLPNTSTIVLPQSNAVSVDYYGNRAESAPAHNAVQAYLKDRNLIAHVPYVEEYVTDVLEEKDPSKWLTKITYRIVE